MSKLDNQIGKLVMYPLTPITGLIIDVVIDPTGKAYRIEWSTLSRTWYTEWGKWKNIKGHTQSLHRIYYGHENYMNDYVGQLIYLNQYGFLGMVVERLPLEPAQCQRYKILWFACTREGLGNDLQEGICLPNLEENVIRWHKEYLEYTASL